MSGWPDGAIPSPRPGAGETAAAGRDEQGEHVARAETFAEDRCPTTR